MVPPGSAIITPPAMVPMRMAMKVPDSTSALPPTSSVSARCCGRMAYLTGPNSEDCAPIRNKVVSISGSDSSAKAVAASAMMPISASLMSRIRWLFSYLSASWPAVAENRKKGRMNSPAARLTSTPADSSV